jgi:anti-anti-sigma factor
MSISVKVIRPSGVLDGASTNQLRGEITEILSTKPDVVLINLQDITFMDSSGLGALVIALKKIRTIGGRLCICSINEQIRMLFELTSLDQIFEIYKDQNAFNEAILSGKK